MAWAGANRVHALAPEIAFYIHLLPDPLVMLLYWTRRHAGTKQRIEDQIVNHKIAPRRIRTHAYFQRAVETLHEGTDVPCGIQGAWVIISLRQWRRTDVEILTCQLYPSP